MAYEKKEPALTSKPFKSTVSRKCDLDGDWIDVGETVVTDPGDSGEMAHLECAKYHGFEIGK